MALQDSDTIRLDQFLKLHHVAQTGGHAKLLIQSGEVQVNGQQETRRRRKLREGDVVEVAVPGPFSGDSPAAGNEETQILTFTAGGQPDRP